MDINIYNYINLRMCAGDTVNTIDDDEEFCRAEFELFRDWYRERGFTEEEQQYVEACGYDLDQFYDEEAIV